ncbi:MAG: CDP-archaeol synthase [Saprospiraceae bacterium]|nr:CDP-archaeol synthase [Saprospiraceae bacterium]
MKDLPIRTATALVLGTVTIGAVYYSAYTLNLLLITIAAIASFEYIKLAVFGAEISSPIGLSRIGAFIASIPLIIAFVLRLIEVQLDTYLLLTFCLTAITVLFTYFLFKNEMGDWRMYQAIATALLYIGLPLFILNWYSGSNGHYEWLKPMSILMLIWCNDMMAYFTGRWLGSRPLYKVISPNKTLEGFIGGLILTVLFSLILSLYIRHLTPIQWILFGFIISFVATIGDLFESMIKRRYGVKDSGNLLPGHGGFLDRFDAFIFVLPVACLYLYLCWQS